MNCGRETIVVVDDDEDLRGAVREVLEDQGYFVLDAPSGAAALNAVARAPGPIHLVLTDVVMPRMSGFELAERLAGVLPEAKFLFMSGYPPDAVSRLRAMSRCACLEKPFETETLTRTIRQLLDQDPVEGETAMRSRGEGGSLLKPQGDLE